MGAVGKYVRRSRMVRSRSVRVRRMLRMRRVRRVLRNRMVRSRKRVMMRRTTSKII